MPRLWAKAQEGYDVVLAHHPERKHATHRNLSAAAFRLVNTVISGNEQPATGLGAYSLVSRKVVDAFLRFPETHRHYLEILRWMGYKAALVEVQHRERLEGTSSYTFRKLVRHAMHGTLGQSQRLLHVAVALGLGYVLAALAGVGYVIVRWAVWGLRPGWASTVVLILASTGFILFALGILGLYIGGIFEQVRGRPLFLIDETTDPPR
jgi:dolichol-phosphate mannosyltransferase